MFKKMQIIFAAVLIVGMLLTSCGSAATPSIVPATAAPATIAPATAAPATGAPATAAPTEPAFSDKVLRVTPSGQPSTTFIRNFNPFGSQALFPTLYGIYEPMMIYNKIKGEIVPWLATDYTWSSDNLTLTFTIRDGVKWSDGESFTANDVAYTFMLLKSNSALSGKGTVVINERGNVSNVVAKDDKTVDFVFKSVFIPNFYDIITQVIVPEHIWKNIADPVKDTNDNPVGTGPFTQVVDFKDQVYEVDRNPNYWQEGKPYFKGLRMPAFPTNDAAGNMLLSGEVDWTDQAFPDYRNTILAKNPDLHCWWPLVSYQVLFMVNNTKPPFDDVTMRKAISLGFDRTKLIDIALQGGSKPTDLTGLNDAYKKWKLNDISVLGDNWVTYDPAKANQMLDDAGYKKAADGFRTTRDGKKMQFELISVNGFTDWVAVAPLLKQELNDIGLDVEIKSYDVAVAYDKWFKGDFDMSLTFSTGGIPTLYKWFSYAMSEKTKLPIGTATSSGMNPWRYSDPAVEPLLDALATNPNDAVQMQIAIELQKLFAKDAPFIPMWSGPTFMCYSTKNFTGFPAEDDQYAAVDINRGGSSPEQLITFTTLKGK